MSCSGHTVSVLCWRKTLSRCCHGCVCTRPSASGIQEIAGHQKASTLEEIERSQIRQTEAADVACNLQDKPLFRQMSASSVNRLLANQPESPNTVLRRTLNIAPPAPADTGQELSPVGSHVNTFQPVKSALPDLTATVQKQVDSSTAVLSGAAKIESSDRLCADVTSSLSQAGLITPQALLQTHFTAKVSQSWEFPLRVL